MTIHAYGLAACDTCRKAKRWAKDEQLNVTWFDIGQAPVPEDILIRAVQTLDTALINRQSTTWRSLSEADKVQADDPARIPALLTAMPKLMKRPLWVSDTGLAIGFRDQDTIKALGR